jgi:DNA polymerase III subunit beta
MKLSSLQENLKQGLMVVGHIASKNINLPILNNIMIEAKDGNIKLIATNLEIGVVSVVRGKVLEEGVVTVDSKIISDFISLLPNKKIDIKQKDNNIFIESDNYKTKITGMSAEEFPLIPQVEKSSFYSADAEEFREAVGQAIFAVSNSETRAELTGVLFNFNKNQLTLAATDSYRLAEKKLTIKSNNNSQDGKRIIVPAKTLQELIRILSNIKEENTAKESVNEVKFYISENQIMFNVGTTELVSRLIEGQYPDYNQIIPNTHKTKIIINKNELVRAVKVAAIFSKAGINSINLDFPKNKNKVIVSSELGQAGENITELDGIVSGDDNGVVINYRYLLDGLNSFRGENIKIEIIDSNAPCVLKEEKDNGYLYVVMPIKQ